MILIQSSQNDVSTDDVVDWLIYLYPGIPIVRLNDRQPVFKLRYDLIGSSQKLVLKLGDGQQIDLDQIKAWWYRRGNFDFAQGPLKIENATEASISTGFLDYWRKEQKSMEAVLDQCLDKQAGVLNRFLDNETNKISNLSIAASIGIGIPHTIITNDISELEAFCQLHNKVITKAFAHNFFKVPFSQNARAGISLDTSIVGPQNIQTLKLQYGEMMPSPALYQQYVEKAFELRIFAMNGTFYPMAIFSQANEKTAIDMRYDDAERPNRCVPYKLPNDIQEKLGCLMEKCCLRSGSLDMIVTPEGKYVFLEINPIGIYQWVREHCNYDIDRAIAISLANYKNTNE